MTMKSDIDIYPLSDMAILQELGQNMRNMRLNQNLSQQELADNAGVDRITIGKLESGRPVTMITMVQVLRALQRLDVLNPLLTEPQITPSMFNEAQEHYRKRASKPRTPKNLPPAEW
jgi:transcriptional regulator with XRE-family HTH domain